MTTSSSAVEIHRSRTCALTPHWETDLASVESLSVLQQDTRVQWEPLDTCGAASSSSCYQTQNIAVSGGSLQLRAASSTGAKIRVISAASDTAEAARVRRLRVRMQLPKLETTAQALVKDVAETSHDLEFVWDTQWLRWYVDDVLLLEEAIPESSAIQEGSATDENGLLEVELSVKATGLDASDASLTIEKLSLTSGNISDPFCGPQYASASNCRAKTPFTPRLGSIQGSLSTDEVEAFIDQVVADLPLLTKVEELGRSVEGRPLRALCLGACYATADQLIPQALFTGMHHARENLVYTIDVLATDYRNGDLAALELLSSRQLWFVLVVNPDGYAHNEALRVWEHNKMGQRKSALPNCQKSPIDAGVDLNRNYDVCFARDTLGSSNDPCGDDYAGPSAFSEPETQAIRDLVERNSSDFSVALNYHSYGKYFNLPFACEAEGEPAEPGRSMFQALAREMARFNAFKYGQSWKDSNLYTVNGETSDWMWQKHGIFAMSPEVGPGFELPAPQGFWPPRADVPQLSADLHYSNLHMTRMAGPVYSLVVKSIQRGDSDGLGSYVNVQVTVSNSGLRAGSAELLGSVFLNGSSASKAIQLDLEAGLESIESADEEAAHTIAIPRAQQPLERLQALYLVLRDAWSCQLFRVSVDFHDLSGNASQPRFQTWTPLPLPRCGTCETFGSTESSQTASTTPMCSEIEDVARLETVNLRNFITTEAAGSESSLSSSSNISSSGTSDQQAAISSAATPLSVSWTAPVTVAAIAGVVVLLVAALLFRRRRRALKPRNVKATGATQKRRSGVQYSRVEAEVASSPTPREDDEDDEEMAIDAEFGERPGALEEEEEELTTMARERRPLSPLGRSAELTRSRSEDDMV
ncbi:hypothetical protein BBJ28_00019889 [Nothophytophthora sp. Chile5]|nr:hypothetical protein BBJ28_00019889 [Nothophytophthora sp. Chile5]